MGDRLRPPRFSSSLKAIKSGLPLARRLRRYGSWLSGSHTGCHLLCYRATLHLTSIGALNVMTAHRFRLLSSSFLPLSHDRPWQPLRSIADTGGLISGRFAAPTIRLFTPFTVRSLFRVFVYLQTSLSEHRLAPGLLDYRIEQAPDAVGFTSREVCISAPPSSRLHMGYLPDLLLCCKRGRAVATLYHLRR